MSALYLDRPRTDLEKRAAALLREIALENSYMEENWSWHYLEKRGADILWSTKEEDAP